MKSEKVDMHCGSASWRVYGVASRLKSRDIEVSPRAVSTDSYHASWKAFAYAAYINTATLQKNSDTGHAIYSAR